MFLCSQSFFFSVFYSWTSVKPEERGNLFPAIEVPSQRDGTCCWRPQALTRLKDGPTLKKTSLDASTNMEARKLFHLIRRRSKLPWRFSFATILSSKFSASHNRHIASSDFVFLKYLTAFTSSTIVNVLVVSYPTYPGNQNVLHLIGAAFARFSILHTFINHKELMWLFYTLPFL